MTTTTPLVGITAHVSLVDDGDGIAVLHHVANVAYAKAIRKAGGVPVLLPMGSAADATAALACVDALLVTGGDDVNPNRYRAEPAPETKAADPARDEFEIELIAAAVGDDRPMLCVCRGIQVLNVALGGTLQQHYDGHFDLPKFNERVHDVRLAPGSMLAKVMGATDVAVNSLHHQTLDVLAPRLLAVGYSDDGLVEGVEVEECTFALGVQWHPELLRHRPEHLALFEALVAAGTRHRT
ncbi:MAG TPA: gamma-glutamyl-gamma-aminobutyrate hydrolase family protein [Acidimicrobiia bacterium]